MPAALDQVQVNRITFRRSLRQLREASGEASPLEIGVIKDHLVGFVEKLQTRYPFTFAIAYRNFSSEVNKQAQERLTTHFLFGAISELTSLDASLKDRVWALGWLLSRQIGMGGENFRPHDFNPFEKSLAEEIGPKNFEILIQKADELSIAMKFRLGPVNSAEHVIAWSFCYVGQFLKAAKWEGTKRH